MKPVKKFESESKIKQFADKNGMKFAGATQSGDDAETWVADARSRGLAVVWSQNHYGPDQGAYLAFHR